MSVRFISKAEVDALPDDPEEAFVILEETVRERYEEEWDQLHDEASPNTLMHRYMSAVLPAAQHYNIGVLTHWTRPTQILGNDSYDLFSQFMADVDYCVAELKLRSSTRAREYSVALDAATRTKLEHLLNQLRETVNDLDVSVTKKDIILKRLNRLRDAIDRERTGFAEFGALMIAACDDVGEAAKRLEPVIQSVERIGAAIGIAKRAEDAQPRIPQRRAPKRIEDKRSKEFEDEIPF